MALFLRLLTKPGNYTYFMSCTSTLIRSLHRSRRVRTASLHEIVSIGRARLRALIYLFFTQPHSALLVTRSRASVLLPWRCGLRARI